MPVLAVGAGGGAFTASTMAQVAAGDITSVQLEGVGHYAAQEAPELLSAAILDFLSGVDGPATQFSARRAGRARGGAAPDARPGGAGRRSA